MRRFLNQSQPRLGRGQADRVAAATRQVLHVLAGLAPVDFSGWLSYVVPLGAYAGQNVKARFRLTSDIFGSGDGVYLDDIRFSGEELVPIEAGGAPE